MAAQLGTGIQLAAVGPQNKLLDLDPDVTMFHMPFIQSSRFASEAVEELPLQTVKFGGTAVFELLPQGDYLGDMHVQFQVPAVQHPLGLRLDPMPPPQPRSEAVAVTGASELQVGPLRVTLGGGPRDGITYGIEGGACWRFEGWSVALFTSGRIEATLHGGEGPQHLAVSGVSGGFVVHPDSTLALHVSGGAAVTHNDTWPDQLAYRLMRRVRFIVDDITVHDHERLWYHLQDQLQVPVGHEAGLRELLGSGLSMGRAHTIVLPLKFMSCGSLAQPRTYFPAMLVSRCSMRVELELGSFAECAPREVLAPTLPPAPLATRLVVEQVTVDRDERNVVLREREVVVMYVGAQDMDALNYDVSSGGAPMLRASVNVDLSELNLPVKALVWVVYPEQVADMFDYRDAVQGATLLFGSLERVSGVGEAFSGPSIFSHGPRCQPGNVYMYSFALRPWEMEPSGAADFSALSKPTLRLDLKRPEQQPPLKCKVWGLTCNWLRFRDGRVTQAFQP